MVDVEAPGLPRKPPPPTPARHWGDPGAARWRSSPGACVAPHVPLHLRSAARWLRGIPWGEDRNLSERHHHEI